LGLVSPLDSLKTPIARLRTSSGSNDGGTLDPGLRVGLRQAFDAVQRHLYKRERHLIKVPGAPPTVSLWFEAGSEMGELARIADFNLHPGKPKRSLSEVADAFDAILRRLPMTTSVRLAFREFLRVVRQPAGDLERLTEAQHVVVDFARLWVTIGIVDVVHWNGRADNGDWVAPGLYEMSITVTDTSGSNTVIKPTLTVRY
jgi:hypothetical protein